MYVRYTNDPNFCFIDLATLGYTTILKIEIYRKILVRDPKPKRSISKNAAIIDNIEKNRIVGVAYL